MIVPAEFARRCVIVSALISGLISSTPANARRNYPDYVLAACKKDFKSFCPRYDIESTQIRQCMRSVADQLSPRCVEALERSGERRTK
jgi:hypothetical protein